MFKLLTILLALSLIGCVTKPIPMPAPSKPPTNYCKEFETTNCRKWSSSEINGPVVRGHHEEVNNE